VHAFCILKKREKVKRQGTTHIKNIDENERDEGKWEKHKRQENKMGGSNIRKTYPGNSKKRITIARKGYYAGGVA